MSKNGETVIDVYATNDNKQEKTNSDKGKKKKEVKENE